MADREVSSLAPRDKLKIKLAGADAQVAWQMHHGLAVGLKRFLLKTTTADSLEDG
jgi:hypothetical protein